MTLGDSLGRRIKEQLISKISALDSVAGIWGFVKLPFDEWPAVFITTGSMDGVFWSTAENERTYSYRCYVLVPIGKDISGVNDDRLQFAEEAVGQVVEEIIDAVDTDYELGQFNSDVCYIEAMDVLYGETEYEGGYAKSAELTIAVHTLKDVSS